MDAEMSTDRDLSEIRKRAEELARHTTLSDREAFVWAAKKSDHGQAWEHQQIAAWLDISESASQNYLARATDKKRTAEATVSLLHDGKNGPVTKNDGKKYPASEDPDELTLHTIIGDIQLCDHWLSMGITALGPDSEIDLEAKKRELVESLLKKVDQEIQAAAADGDQYAVADTRTDGSYNYNTVHLTRDDGEYVFHSDGETETVSPEKMRRLLETGQIRPQ